jgi:hypothetical protein
MDNITGQSHSAQILVVLIECHAVSSVLDPTPLFRRYLIDRDRPNLIEME